MCDCPFYENRFTSRGAVKRKKTSWNDPLASGLNFANQ